MFKENKNLASAFVVIVICTLLLIGCGSKHSRQATTNSGQCAYGYKEDISIIMQQYCISCHSSSNPTANFRADVHDDALSPYTLQQRWALALFRVEAGTMPPQTFPNKMNKNEIDVLKAWVNCGSPLNRSTTSCQPQVAQVSSQTLKHLSKREYINTMTDLVGATIANTLTNEFATLPDDKTSKEFDTMVEDISASHINAYFNVAVKAADAVANDTALTNSWIPCLLSTSNTTPCVESFLDSFGLRTYRRPLTATEKNDYVALFQTASSKQEGLRLILGSLLQSAPFIYKLELNGTPVTGSSDLVELSPYEIASRLSFFILGTMPDSVLFAEAAKGTLSSVTGIKSEATRLMGSAKATLQTKEFYRQWLHLDSLPTPSQSSGFLAGVSTQSMKNDFLNEADDFLKYVTWDIKGSYSDLVTSNAAFVKTPTLASIYGVPIPSDPTGLTFTPAGTRSGILTKPALLLGSSDNTFPIHRGVTVLKQLLCFTPTLPDPQTLPPNFQLPPPFDPSKTNRQRWDEKTQPTACFGCHSQINPFGFVLENFDSIGRYQQTEKVFNSSGALVNTLTVDSTASVYMGSETHRLMGASELGALFSKHGLSHSCFSKQWYRFGYGKMEAFPGDTCTIDNLSETSSKQSIQDVMLKVSELPQFRVRKLSP